MDGDKTTGKEVLRELDYGAFGMILGEDEG